MFQTFVLAGFDCTVGRNVHGHSIHSPKMTQHRQKIREDYALLNEVGIAAIRDGVPWPEIQYGPGRYDWNNLDEMVEASKRSNIEVIYDFCHFGYPEFLDIFSSEFVKCFAEYCYRTTRRLANGSHTPLFISPINEPSYFAWAGGQTAQFPPYCKGRCPELKLQLVRAILAGIEAIWSAAPNSVIVNVDPICRAVAPRLRPEFDADVNRFNNVAVLESWDMISGNLYPELGGSRRHLGVVGVNYYWTNQWEFGNEEVPLSDDDERRRPLRELVEDVWRRYRTDILISETGHIGQARAGWLRQLTHETRMILRAGIPLHGVCIYPILGMPSWHSQDEWLRMGLWDVTAGGKRLICNAMLEALSELQSLAPGLGSARATIGDRHEYATRPQCQP